MYSLVSRVSRPSVRMFSVSPTLSNKAANPNNVWDEREKSAEDMDVKGHEQRLVEALAQKLQEKEVSSQKQATHAEVDLTRQDLESHILALRKELLHEIAETKDEIAELKFRVKRLESKK